MGTGVGSLPGVSRVPSQSHPVLPPPAPASPEQKPSENRDTPSLVCLWNPSTAPDFMPNDKVTADRYVELTMRSGYCSKHLI